MPDDIIDVLIRVLEATDGWAVVSIFFLYVGWRFYDTYSNNAPLRILKDTVESLLVNIDRNIVRLAEGIEHLNSEKET